MNLRKTFTTSLSAATLMLGFAAPGAAAVVDTLEAADNATIGIDGPGDQPYFFNIEGSANGDFATFGVADFDASGFDFGFSGPIGDLLSVTLQLTQTDTFFSTSGIVGALITQDITTPFSKLAYQESDVPDGLGDQLKPRTVVTQQVQYDASQPDGSTDLFSFNLNATFNGTTVEEYLIDQINSGGTIRSVIIAQGKDVAATYAGYNNFDFPGPTLIVKATEATDDGGDGGNGDGNQAPEFTDDGQPFSVVLGERFETTIAATDDNDSVEELDFDFLELLDPDSDTVSNFEQITDFDPETRLFTLNTAGLNQLGIFTARFAVTDTAGLTTIGTLEIKAVPTPAALPAGLALLGAMGIYRRRKRSA